MSAPRRISGDAQPSGIDGVRGHASEPVGLKGAAYAAGSWSCRASRRAALEAVGVRGSRRATGMTGERPHSGCCASRWFWRSVDLRHFVPVELFAHVRDLARCVAARARRLIVREDRPATSRGASAHARAARVRRCRRCARQSASARVARGLGCVEDPGLSVQRAGVIDRRRPRQWPACSSRAVVVGLRAV